MAAPHPLLDRARPLCVAHRGGAKLAPENTIAAFDRGVAAGADAIEFDVRLSADGVPVICHDATLDRTTDATGPVASRTARELARVDAGHRFAPELDFPFRGRGVGVPTLTEVLHRYPSRPLVVELKGHDPALARAAFEVVARAEALGRVCFGGFSIQTLAALRVCHPAVVSSAARDETRWALYRSWIGWPARRAPYRAFQVPEARQGHRIVSPRFVRFAHRAGLSVQVWTIDDPADARRLLGWGVDALITDRPDLIAPLVKAVAPAMVAPVA